MSADMQLEHEHEESNNVDYLGVARHISEQLKALMMQAYTADESSPGL